MKIKLSCLILALLISSASAYAQDNNRTDGQPGKSDEIPISYTAGEVILDVTDKPLQQVLNYISIIGSINIIADSGIDETITLKISRPMPWMEALKLICDRVDCSFSQVSPSLIKVTKPQRISLMLEDAPIDKVITTISAMTAINIIYSPTEIKGVITVNLNNIPWREALDTVVKTAGYAIVEETSGVIRIVPPEKLKTQLETRHFVLKYITPPSTYKGSISSELLIGKPKVVADPIAEFTFVITLKNMLTKDDKGKPLGDLTYDAFTNTVIITDTKPVLDQIESIIKKLDVPPPQVMIDLKVISTANTDLAQMGFQYSGSGLGGLTVSTSPTLGTTGNPKITRLPFGFGREKPIQDNFFMTTYEMNATMRLFKEDSASRILQAPQLIAINGQEATIHVGKEIRWAQTSASSSQSGTLAYELSEADGSPLQTGFQLFVVPYIARDTNNVIMTVVPKNTLFLGFDKFEFASTASGSQSISLPQTQNTTVVTKLMVESGQTAVIGGLIEEVKDAQQEKLPFFGDLPVFGTLFRYSDDATTKNHLIIFITPTIIHGPEEVKDELRRQIEKRLFENSSEFNTIKKGSSEKDVDDHLKKYKESSEDEFEKIRKGETGDSK